MVIPATVETIDLTPLAPQLGLRLKQVESVVALLDEGNTVPFITRYRKDQTGGLDELQVREVESNVTRLRLLAQRKQAILRSIESQGKLTPRLAAEIEAAESMKRLEDLYLPFKPKKQTLATTARERGLEPLADEILSAAASCADLDARAADFVNEDRGVPTAADALLGAGHILAERYSERPDLRGKLRAIYTRTGELVTCRADKGEKEQKSSSAYRDFFEYTEPLGKVPAHRVLAINRGEKAKALRVKVEAAVPVMQQMMEQLLTPADHPHADFLRGCVRDALTRLILPSLEREVRRELTEKAEVHAVDVFAQNLRNLLLQPPVRKRRVLAIDPGFKSGCKLVALDEFANFLGHVVINITGKADDRRDAARAKLVEMINEYNLNVIAIGNGTACRETEALVAEAIASELAEQNVAYVIVNEAGASVYSTSPVGREEFPDFDATVRGAISIGRRLQDPLSELVKIEPANIGVGMYQHDVKAKHLQASLDAVVESAVNFVGVDVNTASVSLLRYVSGLNQLTARRLFEYRKEHGPFKCRSELKETAGFGEATFVQAAGFLRITDSENPLDTTWIHPESYGTAERVLEQLGFRLEQLRDRQITEQIAAKTAEVDVKSLARELDVGELTLKDILTQLARPGRDPREDLPPPLFKTGILKLEDVTPGMELTGSVLNVVDFGAFIDIGLKDSGLVHVSQLSHRFVGDPHNVVSVGDIVKVWVLGVDSDRRRVSLTMIEPGSQAPSGRRRRKKKKRKPKAAAAQSAATAKPKAETGAVADANHVAETGAEADAGVQPSAEQTAAEQGASDQSPPEPLAEAAAKPNEPAGEEAAEKSKRLRSRSGHCRRPRRNRPRQPAVTASGDEVARRAIARRSTIHRRTATWRPRPRTTFATWTRPESWRATPTKLNRPPRKKKARISLWIFAID